MIVHEQMLWSVIGISYFLQRDPAIPAGVEKLGFVCRRALIEKRDLIKSFSAIKTIKKFNITANFDAEMIHFR